MAADYACAANFSVGRDDDFNLDLARNVHPLGKFRIGRRYLALDLAPAFVRGGLLRKDKTCGKQSDCGGSNADTNPTRSHGHYSSSEWELPQQEKGTSNASALKKEIEI